MSERKPPERHPSTLIPAETVKELAGHVRALMDPSTLCGMIFLTARTAGKTSARKTIDAAQAALDKLDQTVAGEGGTE